MLERIVGSSLSKEDGSDGEDGATSRPNELVEDVEFGGLTLKEFAQQGREIQQTPDVEFEVRNAQSAEECKYVY